jgi:hypothetical protein
MTGLLDSPDHGREVARELLVHLVFGFALAALAAYWWMYSG